MYARLRKCEFLRESSLIFLHEKKRRKRRIKIEMRTMKEQKMYMVILGERDYLKD